jgi:peroxiredoxin Q/BCP
MVQLGIAVAMLISSSVFVGANPDLPEVGKPAPEFSLKSNENVEVSLKDLRGKWVVLYFYPKDFTSGCTIQAHNFQRDLKEYEKIGAVIIGISVDSAESHKEFCAKEGLNFKLLADTEGKIAKVFPNVKVQKHSEEVLAALAELQKK